MLCLAVLRLLPLELILGWHLVQVSLLSLCPPFRSLHGSGFSAWSFFSNITGNFWHIHDERASEVGEGWSASCSLLSSEEASSRPARKNFAKQVEAHMLPKRLAARLADPEGSLRNAVLFIQHLQNLWAGRGGRLLSPVASGSALAFPPLVSVLLRQVYKKATPLCGAGAA